MKKIISFSLWGNNPKYTVGAIRNAELALKIYPDWICRFYTGNSVPTEIIHKLQSFENTEIITMGIEGDWQSMFWRFYACEDAEIMISRDTDSRLSPREKEAVDEWLASNLNFHIMRDHPFHATEIPGGMWGCRNQILKNIILEISDFNKKNLWQIDQIFLREIIYPKIIQQAFIHDEYHNYESDKRTFPSARIKLAFVGEAFDENEHKSLFLRLLLPIGKIISLVSRNVGLTKKIGSRFLSK